MQSNILVTYQYHVEITCCFEGGLGEGEVEELRIFFFIYGMCDERYL